MARFLDLNAAADEAAADESAAAAVVVAVVVADVVDECYRHRRHRRFPSD